MSGIKKDYFLIEKNGKIYMYLDYKDDLIRLLALNYTWILLKIIFPQDIITRKIINEEKMIKRLEIEKRDKK